MKTKTFARRWRACKAVLFWVSVMGVALGEVWVMSHPDGKFFTPKSQQISVEGVPALSSIWPNGH